MVPDAATNAAPTTSFEWFKSSAIPEASSPEPNTGKRENPLPSCQMNG
jgi:hypothetical protein